MLIPINGYLFLDESEIEESFIRASGPGGQNVNKVSSAVQIRFDLSGSRSLPEDVRERLRRLAGHRLTREGVIVIIAQRYRSQERNRQDALDRLVALVRRAAETPTPRRPTPATAGARPWLFPSTEEQHGLRHRPHDRACTPARPGTRPGPGKGPAALWSRTRRPRPPATRGRTPELHTSCASSRLPRRRSRA